MCTEQESHLQLALQRPQQEELGYRLRRLAPFREAGTDRHLYRFQSVYTSVNIEDFTKCLHDIAIK